MSGRPIDHLFFAIDQRCPGFYRAFSDPHQAKAEWTAAILERTERHGRDRVRNAIRLAMDDLTDTPPTLWEFLDYLDGALVALATRTGGGLNLEGALKPAMTAASQPGASNTAKDAVAEMRRILRGGMRHE